jgi:hypothetical protein
MILSIMDKDHWQKITSSIVTVIAIVAVLPTTFVYAQTVTTITTPEEENSTTTTTTPGQVNSTTTSAPIQLVTPSAAAQQIINNTKAECEQAQFLQARCVILVYESPTTVVLNGLISIFGGNPESRDLHPNPFLWNAVDDFKAQGYTITDIEMNAVGNRSNDDEFHVIMSK